MKNINTRATLTTFLAAACLAFAPAALAVSPPPDGGYPNANTAEGEDALLKLSSGESNTAIGFHALTSTRKASGNTAVGANALERLGAGGYNTAIGFQTLSNANHTDSNTAIGAYALSETTTGYSNTAMGLFALWVNTTGYRNTASGMNTLSINTTGADNTGYGYGSLLNVTTGNNNIAIGSNAGWRLKTGSNNIDIGADGDTGDSNTIRIGDRETHQATYIAGISGATVAEGVSVVVGADGHLGTVTSSARYKEGVEPMDHSSEAILSLKPVRFRYKKELDPKGIPQFGLVAEQVEKVNRDLVARDDQGKPYTVRYEAVNAMLLNEFLKEHRKVEEQARLNVQQQATITEQQKQIDAFAKSLKEQAGRLQQVSDEVAGSRRDRRLVGK
jgi:hypothetical protein